MTVVQKLHLRRMTKMPGFGKYRAAAATGSASQVQKFDDCILINAGDHYSVLMVLDTCADCDPYILAVFFEGDGHQYEFGPRRQHQLLVLH